MNVEDFWKKWKEENTESLTLKIEVIGSGKLAEGAALATVEKCQAFAEAFHAHMQVERGPRCPKCGNLNLEDRSHIRGVIPHIVCLCCKEMFYVKLLADFAQFFGQAEQPTCLICGSTFDGALCLSCRNIPSQYCGCCGRPFIGKDSEWCADCANHVLPREESCLPP